MTDRNLVRTAFCIDHNRGAFMVCAAHTPFARVRNLVPNESLPRVLLGDFPAKQAEWLWPKSGYRVVFTAGLYDTQFIIESVEP